MDWHRSHMISFDLETTSRSPLDARVVTVSLVIVDPGKPKAIALEWMVAVDEEIPESATAVHGITTEEARAKGAPLAEVLVELDVALRETWLSTVPLLGQNLSYDLTVLACERERCGMGALVVTDQTPVIDLLVCDRAMDRYRPGSRSLESLCRHYGVRHGGAHNSTADALVTARCVWMMAQRYPELPAMGLPELHRRQVEWHREQALGLAAFWRTPRAVSKIERDHSAGLITREEADELVRTLLTRADEVESNADGWPIRRRLGSFPMVSLPCAQWCLICRDMPTDLRNPLAACSQCPDCNIDLAAADDTTWVIGQGADCDIRVSDEYVSTRHCRVSLADDGTVTVEDLGSTNGTWVRRGDAPNALSGVKVIGPTRIVPGWIIRVGRTDIPWNQREELE